MACGSREPSRTRAALGGREGPEWDGVKREREA